jgi:3-oxoacyl-[acyl-carrier protein] reductase
MELGLRGKRALVTAASKGLGRATSEALLSEGCRVCISSRSDVRIQSAAQEMAAAGGEVHAMATDLTDSSACAELFDWAVQTMGGLDILINNTGGPPTGGVLDLDDAEWHRAFEGILMSALRLSRAAIPVMRKSGSGSIVNLVSLSAKQPIDGLALSNTVSARACRNG